MGRREAPISNRLRRVGVRLKRWREAHAAKTRLPYELWAAAVQAAEEEGIYRTARTLHLDYGNLKRKVESSTKARKGKSDKGSIAPAKTAYRNMPTEAAKKASVNRGAVNRGAANRGAQPTQPGAFMELIAGSMGGDCVIELEGESRARMRIQIRLTAPDVIRLVREWRVGAVEFGERQS